MTLVQFVKFTITDSHKWCNEAIKDIILPPDTIFVLLMRGNEQIIPNGNTVILNNDVLILCAPSTDRINGVCFIERNITSGDKFIGKTLSEIKKHSDILIIMIQRNGDIIIPKGQTTVEENDLIVITQTEQEYKLSI